jgi:hypothetical protein
MSFTYTDDDVLVPANPSLAARHFSPGTEYRLALARSDRSHNHYFGAINWAWDNLPEDEAARFPTADDLRKRALIACGHAVARQLVCDTEEGAVRAAAFIGAGKEYSVVSVYGDVVTELTAKSQDRESMDEVEFQKSKDDVISYCAALIGVSVDELLKASRADYAKRSSKGEA